MTSLSFRFPFYNMRIIIVLLMPVPEAGVVAGNQTSDYGAVVLYQAFIYLLG